MNAKDKCIYFYTPIEKPYFSSPELNELTNKLSGVENLLDTDVSVALDLLLDKGFIEETQETQNTQETQGQYSVLLSGHIASHFKEVPCLIFASLIIDKKLVFGRLSIRVNFDKYIRFISFDKQ